MLNFDENAELPGVVLHVLSTCSAFTFEELFLALHTAIILVDVGEKDDECCLNPLDFVAYDRMLIVCIICSKITLVHAIEFW